MDKPFQRFLCLLCTLFLLINIFLPIAIYATEEDNGSTIVYITYSGKKYHRETCGYLHSKKSIELREAVEKGYKPCSRCSPPRYNGTISSQVSENNNSSSENSKKTENSAAAKTSTAVVKNKSSKKTPWYITLLCVLAVPLVPCILIIVGGLVMDILSLPVLIIEFIQRKRNK